MDSLKELVEQDLSDFHIIEMTEVYKTDVEGRGKALSLGFFKDPTLAKAFIGLQVDQPWHKTETQLVLTNGEVGFLLGSNKPITLFNDEEEAVRIKEGILAKLTDEERAVLKI